MSLDMGLVAHWPLRSDARDAFGQCHGDARGVRFELGAASFDGRGVLKLFVDGREVARSESFDAADFTVSTEKPLLVGFGVHDYFCGSMRDLRWYSRALTAEEVAHFADV